LTNLSIQLVSHTVNLTNDLFPTENGGRKGRGVKENGQLFCHKKILVLDLSIQYYTPGIEY